MCCLAGLGSEYLAARRPDDREILIEIAARVQEIREDERADLAGRISKATWG